MKKLFLLTSTVCLLANIANSFAEPVVGIIVPLEHKAMTEIVGGFRQELRAKYKHPVTIVVKNAEHDPMLERSIIKEYEAGKVNIVEPIGEDAFEMSLATIKNKPVVGIAAEFSEQQRKTLHNKQVANIDDELSSADQLNFIHQAMPDLKKITILHSADDKIYSEVVSFKKAANAKNIAIQDLTVQQMPDLYTISKHVDKDSQAIFILKDHLVVNGIAAIVKQAEKMHIPVIASDDGSVQGGAAFALGVREKDTGILAADVTAEILKGKSASKIPMIKQDHYHVFVNVDHAYKQGINIKKLMNIATKYHYSVVKFDDNGDTL